MKPEILYGGGAVRVGDRIVRLRDVRAPRELLGHLVRIVDAAEGEIRCSDGWVGPAEPVKNGLTIVDTAAVMTCDEGLTGLGFVERGAVVFQGGKVAWVGPEKELPDGARSLPQLAARGGLVTPGLVDAHAHPVFAGDRAAEFAERAAGRTYREIAAAGGGILDTVRRTRAASDDELLAGAAQRLARALRNGTTTSEAKTGYALSVAGELRLLDVIRTLSAVQPVALRPSLLGAHAVPPEVGREEYVAACAGPMIDGARGKAAAVDVYCDEGAFTFDEARRILEAARAAGLAVRAHAGQFADLGAARLVAALGGLSADHLEQVNEDDARLMATAGTAATLLAGACVQLRLPPPPVELLRRAGCRLALGTDCNPGSSHSESLPLQMWLATTHLGLTVDEAWLGVTRHAARAAGRPAAGRLAIGSAGDAVVWSVADYRMVPYHYGQNHAQSVVVGGRIAWERPPGDA